MRKRYAERGRYTGRDRYAGRRLRNNVSNFFWRLFGFIVVAAVTVWAIKSCTPWFNAMEKTVQ